MKEGKRSRLEGVSSLINEGGKEYLHRRQKGASSKKRVFPREEEGGGYCRQGGRKARFLRPSEERTFFHCRNIFYEKIGSDDKRKTIRTAEGKKTLKTTRARIGAVRSPEYKEGEWRLRRKNPALKGEKAPGGGGKKRPAE